METATYPVQETYPMNSQTTATYPVHENITAQEPEKKELASEKSVSCQEAASLKGYCDATIRALCKSGKLDFVKKGGRYYIAIETNGVINAKFAELRTKKAGKLYQELQRSESKNKEMKSYIRSLESKLGITEGQSEFNFSEE